LNYLPRTANAAVAQMLDRGEQLRARIAQLHLSPDPWERVRVAVELAA
jgi:maltooligosyltrehalose synthase